MKPIIYKNKVYSKSELAKTLGISITTLSKYLDTYNGDVEKIVELLNNKKVYQYKNKIYNSLSELSEATRINRKSLTRILKEISDTEGNIIEVDTIVEAYYGTKTTYRYGKEEYKSIKQAAKSVGINCSTLTKYLSLANNDMEKAMQLYHDEHTYCILNGVRYSSQAELAKSLCVNKATLKKYIEKNGNIEDAVQEIKTRFSEEYEWNGKKYYSLESLSKAMNVPRPTLKRILENEAGGDIDIAYKIYQERNSGKYHGYEYNGEKYSSIAKLLKAYDLSTNKFYSKIDENEGNIKKTIDDLILEKEEKQKKAIESEKIREISMRKKPQYIFRGKVYNTIASLSRESGISESEVGRLMKKYDNNLDIALQEKPEPIIYKYDGKNFNSIKALSEYTGIRELRLGRYIRKYNRNAEKAILMIKLRDDRMKKNTIVNDSQINLQDMAIILGIKYSELITYLKSRNEY